MPFFSPHLSCRSHILVRTASARHLAQPVVLMLCFAVVAANESTNARVQWWSFVEARMSRVHDVLHGKSFPVLFSRFQVVMADTYVTSLWDVAVVFFFGRPRCWYSSTCSKYTPSNRFSRRGRQFENRSTRTRGIVIANFEINRDRAKRRTLTHLYPSCCW